MRLNTLESNLSADSPNDWKGTSAQDLSTAMVLAAGRGERMRPLTDHTPKPLLKVHDKPLMQWHMEALAEAGHHDQLINTAWLGPQIESHFGWNPDLPKAGRVRLRYSHEGQDFGYALETAGGIVRAMPYLASVFGWWLVISTRRSLIFQTRPLKISKAVTSWRTFGWFPTRPTILGAILVCRQRVWR